MALYITNRNQDILWNAIRTNTYLEQYFSRYDPSHKSQWFRDIIGTIYEKHKYHSLSVSELQAINRETISYMIDDVKRRNTALPQQSTSTYSAIDSQNKTNSFTTINTPPVEKNNRKDIYASEFDVRQKEYQSMVEKKVPEEVDFRDKIQAEDTIITNMDELVKKHLFEREKELQVHTYKEYVESAVPPTQQVLKIDNSSNIAVHSEQLEVEDKNDKKVSWANELLEEDRVFLKQAEYDKLLKSFDKIDAYEKQMKELADNCDSIQMDMKLIMKKIDNLSKKEESK
jgi:hypothetical protein